jgi:hypothetical protein
MTTITALTGLNRYGEKYVLFASDSQSSITGENNLIKNVSYSAKKVFSNKEKSMIFAYAGKEIFFENQALVIRNKADEFIASKERPATDIREELELLDHMVHYEEIRDGKAIERNQYLFAGKGDLILNSSNIPYITFGTIRHETCGSGSICIDLNKDQDNFIQDLTSGNFEGVLRREFGHILEAARNDRFTGGHFDFGILTKERVKIYRNFAKLRPDKSEEELFEVGKIKLLINPLNRTKGVRSIDDLIN